MGGLAGLAVLGLRGIFGVESGDERGVQNDEDSSINILNLVIRLFRPRPFRVARVLTVLPPVNHCRSIERLKVRSLFSQIRMK